MLYLPLVLAILGLIFMIVKASWVNKQTTGNERMQSISKSIKEGAMAFLNAEYRILGALSPLLLRFLTLIFFFIRASIIGRLPVVAA